MDLCLMPHNVWRSAAANRRRRLQRPVSQHCAADSSNEIRNLIERIDPNYFDANAVERIRLNLLEQVLHDGVTVVLSAHHPVLPRQDRVIDILRVLAVGDIDESTNVRILHRKSEE